MVPAAASRQTDVMPAAGLEVHEVAEILGEHCCALQGLPDADRLSRPKYMVQSYLVRGSFVEPAQDDDPKDWTGRQWTPVPLADMYWVEEADVLKVLHMTQLKKAVLKRQKVAWPR
jgi:hypothetical protein